jgi:hypothetical protein
MKNLLMATIATGALALLTGCNVHLFNTPGNWPEADLTAATNILQSAGIPTGLKNFEVDNCYGNVHITGSDNGTARWSWKLGVRACNDAIAQRIAGRASCKVEMIGHRLTLVVLLPNIKESHNFQSDFEISLLITASVRVQNRFGRVEIADLAGEVEASDENGRVEIRNIGGGVRARTSFDSLTISNTGPAALKNQNGPILAIVIGGVLDAATSFDTLTVRDVRGSALLANQNGKIAAGAIQGSLDARTSFDSLVAKDIGGAATLRNQNGRIEAAGIGGPLDASTSFDSLVARDIGGPVRLRDQNGSIKIIKAGGDADIETSFDSLKAEGIQGDAILVNQNGGVVASGITGSVRASTSFAGMEIAGAGAKFHCHNQNGPIRLRATSMVTSIEAKTSFDTLEIHLPAGLKPVIHAHTTFAEVESDFPVLLTPHGEDPFDGVAPDVARITLQNENGRIGIVRD